MSAKGSIVMATGRCPLPGEEARRPVLATGEVRWPILWLTLIVGLGLFLRSWHINDSLQLDEFGPLYAVAERATTAPGLLPASSDPLVLVPGWGDVRTRSVLPYGIIHPIPLYHYLLYGVVHVLPISEWSLRLPSLLAGLACIVA